MARKKISEYKAKSILLENSSYSGICLNEKNNYSSEKIDLNKKYVLKVDQGVKKRFKNGLIKVGISGKEVASGVAELKEKGYSQFLLEEYIEHDPKGEKYISLERTRSGVKMIYSDKGGVNIEEMAGETIEPLVIRKEEDIEISDQKVQQFVLFLYQLFEEQHFAFLEINPFVINDEGITMLDCAVLVDDAAEYFVDKWNGEDFIQEQNKTKEEIEVGKLDESTPASFKLKILNPNGAFFFLLAGGGASITLADEAYLQGFENEIVNYGEYSGGPSREETYLYVKQIINLIKNSSAKKKALIIAGGVANFTDVYQTFLGIIDAMQDELDILKQENIKVFVRRGGPNEEKGLSLMKGFLEKNDLYGSVEGSQAILVKPVWDAIEYIK